MALFIRERNRRGRPREAYGEHVAWTEWQVVDGRKVLSRWDFQHQAKADLERRSLAEPKEKVMGEIAEMMLDGTLCEGCGSYIDDSEPGHPRYCSRQCAEDCGASWGKPKGYVRSSVRASVAEQAVGAKGLKWLRAAALQGGGMYPGVHADLAPGIFRRLEKRGLVALYEPHNPVHKPRYVITDVGRAVLAASPATTEGEGE